jgi:hypothetical protein
MENPKSANEKAIEAYEESLETLNKKRIKYESEENELRAKFEGELLILKERYDLDNLKTQIEKEEQLLKILKGEIVIPSINTNNSLEKQLEIKLDAPKTYTEAKNFRAKVAFVIMEIKRGTVDQVKECLLIHEPNINQKSLADLNQRLSAMKQAGELFKINKVGKKFVYSIYPENYDDKQHPITEYTLK